MDIQQHDDVVVEAAVISVGLRQALREGEVLQREREAPGAGVWLPSVPLSLYRPQGGGAGPWRCNPQGGGGQGGWFAPQAKWRRPPALGFPTLGAGGPRVAHQPTRG